MIIHGRVFRISEPTVGPRRTHHRSPLRSTIPPLLDCVRQCVPLALERTLLSISIHDVAGASQYLIAFPQLNGKSFGHVTRTMPRRYSSDKLGDEIFRKAESDLLSRHKGIIP